MTFDEAFEKLIGNEGGYTNDPRDSGNWTGGHVHAGELRGTKYGISAASYPKVDIEALSLEGAKAIYKRDYWDPLITKDIPQNIRFDLFDVAVNSGPKYAAQLLQKALGVNPDGYIGPTTIAALMEYPSSFICNRLNAYRLIDMTDMSGWNNFGKGWARRIANNIILDNTI